MPMRRLFFLIGIVLVIGFALAVWSIPRTVHSLPVFLSVGDRVGFNLDGNALYMGKGLAGSVAERGFEVTNPYNETVYVRIVTEGDLAPWLTVVPSVSMRMGPNEKKMVVIRGQIPFNALDGDYNGTIRIVFYWDNPLFF